MGLEFRTMTPNKLPSPLNRWPLLGQFPDFLWDPPGYLVRLKTEYGGLVGFRLGPRQAVLISEPDLIEQVLVTDARLFEKSRGLKRLRTVLGNGLLTSEGEFHLRQRRLSSKAFRRQRIANYAEAMVEFSETWCHRQRPGQVEVTSEMMKLTLNIVAKTLFNSDSTKDAARVERVLTYMQKFFGFSLLPFSEQIEKLPLPVFRRFRAALEELDSIIFRIIEERRKDPVDRGDLLSMLMLAADDEGGGQQMNDVQLRDEIVTIFLAGHETTANTLAWTLYLLSLNPHCEERLGEEIRQVLGQRSATSADFESLVYTKQVISESMRLYPPAWALGRTPIDDYSLAGHLLPAGSVLLMSPYVCHRDPKYFPRPLMFDPDRFSSERVSDIPKYAYYPFGGGVRKCMGERFAWMEAVLILATLYQHWRFEYHGSQAVEGWPAVTLRPKGGIPMRLVPVQG